MVRPKRAHLLRPPCASPRFAKLRARRRSVSNTAPPPFGLFCAAILLCDLSRSAAHALTPARAFAFFGRGPLASSRRTNSQCKNFRDLLQIILSKKSFNAFHTLHSKTKFMTILGLCSKLVKKQLQFEIKSPFFPSVLSRKPRLTLRAPLPIGL